MMNVALESHGLISPSANQELIFVEGVVLIGRISRAGTTRQDVLDYIEATYHRLGGPRRQPDATTAVADGEQRGPAEIDPRVARLIDWPIEEPPDRLPDDTSEEDRLNMLDRIDGLSTESMAAWLYGVSQRATAATRLTQTEARDCAEIDPVRSRAWLAHSLVPGAPGPERGLIVYERIGAAVGHTAGLARINLAPINLDGDSAAPADEGFRAFGLDHREESARVIQDREAVQAGTMLRGRRSSARPNMANLPRTRATDDVGPAAANGPSTLAGQTVADWLTRVRANLDWIATTGLNLEGVSALLLASISQGLAYTRVDRRVILEVMAALTQVDRLQEEQPESRERRLDLMP